MSTSNLLRIGKIPIKARPFKSSPFVSLRRKESAERVVKKAIYKVCPPALAEEAINGYRMSSGTDEDAETDFLKTDQPYHPVKRDYHYRRALRIVEKLFRPSRRLHPIAYPDLRYYPWSLNVSAEYPYTTSPKWIDLVREKQRDGEIDDGQLSFHNLYNEIFEKNRTLVHQIKNKGNRFWNNGVPLPYGWVNLHSRAHLVKTEKEDKIRAVFGVPKLLLMVENMFIWNIQKEYLNEKVKSPMLWGFETARGGWMKLWNKLSSKRVNSVFSADWSGFDHRALHEIIDDVHGIWRSWFDFEQYEPTNFYPESKTDPERIENLWHWMCEIIKSYPIRAASGNAYQWQFNGIASGYQQTQLLDSFVNAIMLLTCLSAVGINIEVPDFTLHVQGDDSLSTFAELCAMLDKKGFLRNISREALTRFNAVLSEDKSFFSESLSNVEVLSYMNQNGIAYRKEAELLAHLLYPERPRDWAATAAAAIGIALASMGCSRLVYLVCQDVHSFLVNTMGIVPDPSGIAWMVRSGMVSSIPDLTKFPNYEECFFANFCVKGRTPSDKEKLWPTKPTRVINQDGIEVDGFRFLNN